MGRMDALVERRQRPPGGVPDDESAAEAFDDEQREGANEQNAPTGLALIAVTAPQP